jgi:hypothetical protein
MLPIGNHRPYPRPAAGSPSAESTLKLADASPAARPLRNPVATLAAEVGAGFATDAWQVARGHASAPLRGNPPIPKNADTYRERRLATARRRLPRRNRRADAKKRRKQTMMRVCSSASFRDLSIRYAAAFGKTMD